MFSGHSNASLQVFRLVRITHSIRSKTNDLQARIRREPRYFVNGGGAEPREGLFRLNLDHPAYETMASIIVGAAFDPRRSIYVYTEAEISSQDYGLVDHINLT